MMLFIFNNFLAVLSLRPTLLNSQSQEGWEIGAAVRDAADRVYRVEGLE